MTSVELVREAYALLAAADIDGFLELVDDRFVIDETERVPWGGRTQGRAGVVSFIQNMRRYIDSVATPTEYLDSGECVVAIGRPRGVVTHTEASVDVRDVHASDLRRNTRGNPPLRRRPSTTAGRHGRAKTPSRDRLTGQREHLTEGGNLMHLSPKETDRLLLFLAAELGAQAPRARAEAELSRGPRAASPTRSSRARATAARWPR